MLDPSKEAKFRDICLSLMLLNPEVRRVKEAFYAAFVERFGARKVGEERSEEVRRWADEVFGLERRVEEAMAAWRRRRGIQSGGDR